MAGYGFSLKIRLSIYDLEQNLISSKIIDSTYVIGEDYVKELRKKHTKAINLILKKYPSIELFEIKYLSFCDFLYECNDVKVQYDDSENTSSLMYEDKKYTLNVFKDSSHYFLRDLYLNEPPSFPINSVRIYEAGNLKLVVAHLGTDSHLPEIRGFGKEYQDKKLDYSSVKTFVYQEPVNHHGYGVDVFISIKK